MKKETKKTKKTAAKKVKKAAVKKRVKKAEVVKIPEEKEAVVVKEVKIAPEAVRYYEAVGRRKTSVARIRLFTKGEKTFLVNDKPNNVYFPTFELQQIVTSPFVKMNCLDKFRAQVKVKGGGIHSQAEAVRHGISRALVSFNPDFKKRLKKAGFLTRDPRMRERKKFGLKRARRAPQWQKR